MRNEQLIRQWRILMFLSARSGASYRDVLATLRPDDAVSLRTLQRDLQALGMAGFLLESESRGREVVWSLRLPRGLPFPIELAELIALQSAALAARRQRLPESRRLVTLCGKVFLQLPARMREFLRAVEQSLVFLWPAAGQAGREEARPQA